MGLTNKLLNEKQKKRAEYYQKNKDKIKLYRKNHPEISKKSTAKWREKNRDYYLKQLRDHKKQVRKNTPYELQKKLDHERHIKYREKLSERRKKRRVEIRKEIFNLLGTKCINPFNIDHSDFEKNQYYLDCLQIDHVNNDGYLHRKHGRVSSSTYYLDILKAIQNGSKDYQLMCPTCNWLKKIQRKALPDTQTTP